MIRAAANSHIAYDAAGQRPDISFIFSDQIKHRLKVINFYSSKVVCRLIRKPLSLSVMHLLLYSLVKSKCKLVPYNYEDSIYIYQGDD